MPRQSQRHLAVSWLLLLTLTHTSSGSWWHRNHQIHHDLLIHKTHLSQHHDLKHLQHCLKNCFTEELEHDCYSQALEKCLKMYDLMVDEYEYYHQKCVQTSGLFSCGHCLETEEKKCQGKAWARVRDEDCCHACWDEVSLCKEDPHESGHADSYAEENVIQNCQTLNTAQHNRIKVLKTCIHACVTDGVTCKERALPYCVDKFELIQESFCMYDDQYMGCNFCRMGMEATCMIEEDVCCERCWEGETLCTADGQ